MEACRWYFYNYDNDVYKCAFKLNNTKSIKCLFPYISVGLNTQKATTIKEPKAYNSFT